MLIFWGCVHFSVLLGDLREKQEQIQTLEEDIERLAAEHATSMEQLVLEVNKAVKERDEIRKELQIDMDAAVMQSNKELDQMKEQYTLLKENSAKKVGVDEIRSRWSLKRNQHILDELMHSLKTFS